MSIRTQSDAAGSSAVSHDGYIANRLSGSQEFRRAMLGEIARGMLNGELAESIHMLGKYVRATIGFAALETMAQREQGSLEAAFAVQDKSFVSDALMIVWHLEQMEGSQFEVVQRAA